MSVLIVDTGAVSKVSKSLAILGSTKKYRIRSSRSTKCELVKSKTLSSSRKDALACIFGKGKCTYSELRDLQHTNIVGDLSNNDGNLAILVLHVLGKTVKSNGRMVDLGHVKTLHNGSTKVGIRTTGKELVQLDEKTSVGVCGLDDLGGGLVSGTATTCFQINSHVVAVLELEDRNSLKKKNIQTEETINEKRKLLGIA